MKTVKALVTLSYSGYVTMEVDDDFDINADNGQTKISLCEKFDKDAMCVESTCYASHLELFDPEKNSQIAVGNTLIASPRSQKEMADAFALVRNKENWKMPINTTLKTCDDAMVRLIESAVLYYTGSRCEVTRKDDGKVNFKASGYYIAIGA